MPQIPIEGSRALYLRQVETGSCGKVGCNNNPGLFTKALLYKCLFFFVGSMKRVLSVEAQYFPAPQIYFFLTGFWLRAPACSIPLAEIILIGATQNRNGTKLKYQLKIPLINSTVVLEAFTSRCMNLMRFVAAEAYHTWVHGL